MAFQIQKFGFPVEDSLEAPSKRDDEIARMSRHVAFILAALLVSVFLNLTLVPKVIIKADAIPFVADGGVFGCQVATVTGPVEEGLEGLRR